MAQFPIETDVDEGVAIVAKVFATRTVLRACPTCGAVHPLALNLETTICQGCGAERGGASTEEVSAKLTGLWGVVAHALLEAGRWLVSLAKRI